MNDPTIVALLALGIGAARTAPVAWMVPALGGPRAGAQVRLGIAVVLAALMVPRVTVEIARAGLAGAGAILWALVIARELAVGGTVGLVAGLAFRAAEAAGALADDACAVGGREGGAETGPGPLASLYGLLAILVFVELGGVGRLVAALARSYDAVPLALSGVTGGLRGAALVVAIASMRLIEAAVGLAAPVLVSLLLADVAIAVVGRLVPGSASGSLAGPLRALVGLGAVLLGLAALLAALTAGLPGWLALAASALAGWRP